MNMQRYPQDEVDLRRYLDIIFKRKKLILTVFFICILAAAVLNLLMPEVYVTTAVIQNGYVMEQVIKTQEIEETIKSYGFLTPIIKELNLKTDPQELKQSIGASDIKNTNYSRIKVKYNNAQLSLKLCQALVNSYINFGNSLYQKKLAIITQQVNELNGQIKTVEKDIENTRRLIRDLGIPQKTTDSEKSIRLILLQSIISNYEANLRPLIDNYNQLQLVLNEAQEFKVVDLPVEPKFPIEPNKSLNLMVAGMLGLFAGVLLTFIAEFWKNSK